MKYSHLSEGKILQELSGVILRSLPKPECTFVNAIDEESWEYESSDVSIAIGLSFDEGGFYIAKVENYAKGRKVKLLNTIFKAISRICDKYNLPRVIYLEDTSGRPGMYAHLGRKYKLSVVEWY